MSTIKILLAILLFTDCAAQSPIVPLWKTVPVPPPMPLAEKSGYASVNGIQLYYAIFHSSAKQPVILLHGGLSSSDFWSNEVALLSKTHEVIVVDSRGHGRSSLSATPLSYELMASDVLTLMDQLHLGKASIVGWSDGGIIGLVLAMRYPGRIDKLFTFGANFSKSGEADSEPDSIQFAHFRSLVEANYRRTSPTPDSFPALRRVLGALYSHEPELDTNDLKRIIARTTVAYGQYEQFYTPEHFKELSRLIAHSRLVVLPNVGHGGPLQDPEGFHRAVMKWIRD
jgi:pimeloyl-ACP methyl ester carboxylesterase